MINFISQAQATVYSHVQSIRQCSTSSSTSSSAIFTTVNIQNFGAAKFRHFTIFDISAAIYFRRGVEGMV